jgi:hypothetical protein
MLHRVVAVFALPAHLVNRQLDGLLARLGLGRIPGALLLGIAFAALTASTASTTMAAFDARPTAQEVTLAQVANGRIGSGLWIAFDAELLDGPHRSTVSVSQGGGEFTEVERVHYLVADPAEPDHAMVVRFSEPIAQLEAAPGPVRLDGTITEDQFNMRALLDEWPLRERYPDVVFSDSRYIAYAFTTPWLEPSWVGTFILGAIAMLFLAGALVPVPVFRATRLVPTPGPTPIELNVHGVVPTPREPVRLRGTSAQLAWMNVEEVARTQWRYWGAELGDYRRDVEEAVRAHGPASERLVLHGQAGSVLWPIEGEVRLDVDAGDAYVGWQRLPALRVRGDGVAATLTFASVAARDAAAAELARA